jgi:hypothetical protein
MTDLSTEQKEQLLGADVKDSLKALHTAFDSAGFRLLKTLNHNMFRFDVTHASLSSSSSSSSPLFSSESSSSIEGEPVSDLVLTSSQLKTRLQDHPLFQSALSRLGSRFHLHIEPNVRYTASEVQTDPVWNLDRIDQTSSNLDRRYGHNHDGDNAHIYVMDSGIRTSHIEFEGRAKFLWSALDNGQDTGDCNGHGTHVAGIAVSKTYGVAKKATVWSVKVLDCNGWGSTATILDAMDVVAAEHQNPSVLSMSLGGPRSRIMDGKATILTGTENVLIVVAAGNDNADACDQSPARNGGVITVGASTNQDAKASFSNWGRCLDIFAPGLNIRSLSAASDTATTVLSGTSMAAPMVSGVVALWLDQNPDLLPDEMFDTILRNSTEGVIKGLADDKSPNRLLYQPFNEGYDYVAEDTSIMSMLQDDWMLILGLCMVVAFAFFLYYARRKKAPRQEALLIGGAGVSGAHIGSEEAMNLSDLMPYDLSQQPGTGHYVNMDGYNPPTNPASVPSVEPL